jgi:hypothetical protein
LLAHSKGRKDESTVLVIDVLWSTNMETIVLVPKRQDLYFLKNLNLSVLGATTARCSSFLGSTHYIYVLMVSCVSETENENVFSLLKQEQDIKK